jgi:hypothetical protein
MPESDNTTSYDVFCLKVLEGLEPAKPRGFTISHDLGLVEPERKMEACCAMLRADPSLWFVRAADHQGRRMLAYRDPFPGR